MGCPVNDSLNSISLVTVSFPSETAQLAVFFACEIMARLMNQGKQRQNNIFHTWELTSWPIDEKINAISG